MTSYLSAFKEPERSADVGDPVDSFELAALLARLQMEVGGSRRNGTLAEYHKKASKSVYNFLDLSTMLVWA